jgi:TolB-like protein/Tfp pilus assembly protein PilF
MGDSPSSEAARRALEMTPEDRLESWKEIASYLKRDVRTVQRWEKKEGLPVHRHVHEKLGSVYAYKSELDAWWHHAEHASLPEASADDPVEEVAEEPAVEAAPDAAEPEKLEAEAAPRAEWRRWWIVVAIVIVLLAVGYGVRQWIRPATGHQTLAVRPFDNLSGDPNDNYFSDGMTDEMITQLGRVDPGRLAVIARATSMRYKGRDIASIAKELHASLVLEGTVRKDGNSVRISAELVRASDQTQVWSGTFDRDLRDILILQQEVAENIATEISATLTTPKRVMRVNPLAYEDTLRGRDSWNRRGPEAVAKAIAYFEQAVATDPKYAPAHAGLADAYALLGSAQSGVMPPREAMPKARAEAERAIALDPTLAEPHASLGLINLVYERDNAAAEREFKAALALAPGYATAHQWYGLYFVAAGRFDDALAQLREAEQLDPQSLAVALAMSEAYYFARQPDRALDYARKAAELEPASALAAFNLARAYEQKKMYDEAITEFQRGEAISGGAPSMVAARAQALGVAGRKPEALALVAQLEQLSTKRYLPAIYFVMMYTGLHDLDHAFAWLKKAQDERSDYLPLVAVEPMADPLRADPRYAQILKPSK